MGSTNFPAQWAVDIYNMSTEIPSEANETYGIHPLGWLLYISVALLLITAIVLPFFVSFNLWVYVPVAYVIAGLPATFVAMQEGRNMGWHD